MKLRKLAGAIGRAIGSLVNPTTSEAVSTPNKKKGHDHTKMIHEEVPNRFPDVVNGKPRVERPDKNAKAGAPLRKWELDLLSKQYPNGYFVSAFPKSDPPLLTRKQARQFTKNIFADKHNNRKITAGRVAHRIMNIGDVQNKKVAAHSPVNLKRIMRKFTFFRLKRLGYE